MSTDTPDTGGEADAEPRVPSDIPGSDLTAFQHQILIILGGQARYGLAIKRQLEAYYGEEVHHGRLYPNLDDLVERGLVEKSELDKRTNQYALTSDGGDVITAQRQWEDSYIKSGSADSGGNA